MAGKRLFDIELKTALIESLAVKIGRPIDLIDLDEVGESLWGQRLAGGRRLLGSSERYAAFLRRNLFDQLDFIPYRNRILAKGRRAWLGI